MKRIVAALLLVLVLPYPSWGQARILKSGETVNEIGVFIPAKDAIDAANMLDRYNILVERVNALEAETAGQMAQIELLEASLGSTEKEIEIKDLILKHKDEMLSFRKEINDSYRELLTVTKDQMLHDKAAIERLEKQVESANKRGLWGTLFGLIVGAAVSFFSHGLIH